MVPGGIGTLGGSTRTVMSIPCVSRFHFPSTSRLMKIRPLSSKLAYPGT
jgi:hypothetical protein